MSDTRKAISLRLSPEQYEALKWCAKTDGLSMTESIIEAINQHIARRVKSPAFQRALQERLARLDTEHEAETAALRRLLE